MDEFGSLSHSMWECKYHVVFIRKCRRKTLYEQLRRYLGELFRKLTEQKESRIEERVLSATPRNPGRAGRSRAAVDPRRPPRGARRPTAVRRQPWVASVRDAGGCHAAGLVRRRFGTLRLGTREGFDVVPGHPGRRIERHLGRVAQQGNEVVKRLGLVELGRVDQRHEQITDARAVQRPLPISDLNIYGDWLMVSAWSKS
jgi:hypothetical protein